MFPNGYPYSSASMSWPRPFVVGFILLMLFLSLSNSPDARDGGAPLQPAAAGGPAAATTEPDGLRKGVKEQIIYDLSLANERLEGEIQRLKQYVLDLRRAAREAGLELRDDAILTLYPELGSGAQGGSGEEKAASSGAEEGAADDEKGATAGKATVDSASASAEGKEAVPLGSRRARVGSKATATPPAAADDIDARP